MPYLCEHKNAPNKTISARKIIFFDKNQNVSYPVIAFLRFHVPYIGNILGVNKMTPFVNFKQYV